MVITKTVDAARARILIFERSAEILRLDPHFLCFENSTASRCQ